VAALGISVFEPPYDNTRLVGNLFMGITSGLPVIQKERLADLNETAR